VQDIYYNTSHYSTTAGSEQPKQCDDIIHCRQLFFAVLTYIRCLVSRRSSYLVHVMRGWMLTSKSNPDPR